VGVRAQGGDRLPGGGQPPLRAGWQGGAAGPPRAEGSGRGALPPPRPAAHLGALLLAPDPRGRPSPGSARAYRSSPGTGRRSAHTGARSSRHAVACAGGLRVGCKLCAPGFEQASYIPWSRDARRAARPARLQCGGSDPDAATPRELAPGLLPPCCCVVHTAAAASGKRPCCWWHSVAAGAAYWSRCTDGGGRASRPAAARFVIRRHRR